MIDTSVLVAGIPGFKSSRAVENPGITLLREWLDSPTFTWHITGEILSEYKEVLARLGVIRSLIGEVVNRLREAAEIVEVRNTIDISPDPADDPFCACAVKSQNSPETDLRAH